MFFGQFFVVVVYVYLFSDARAAAKAPSYWLRGIRAVKSKGQPPCHQEEARSEHDHILLGAWSLMAGRGQKGTLRS